MEIKLELIGKDSGWRDYAIRYRKDRRYSFKYTKASFIENDDKKWYLAYMSMDDFIPREVIVKVESIMRGLNS